MKSRGRLIALSALILGLSSLTAGTAAARTNVELSPAGAVSLTASRLTFFNINSSIICDVTLSGVTNRVIRKIEGTFTGVFERDTVANCTSSIGGVASVDFLTERALGGPCTIRYDNISGRLPSITAALFEIQCGFLMRIESGIFGRIGCLYRGSSGIGSSENPFTVLRLLASNLALVTDLRLEINACPSQAEISGSFTISPRQRLILLEV